MGLELGGNSTQPAQPTGQLGGSSVPSTGGGISLVKGEKVSLTKTAPGLTKVSAGLGWNAQAGQGAQFDLDAQAILLDVNGRARTQKDLIFFNSKVSTCGSVVHTGDNTTGVGDGDDETININLATIPEDVAKIVFTVTIYEATNRGQNFGQVSDAYIRLYDQQTGQEIIKYDLSEDYSTAISLIVGEIYRHNGEWKFTAKGEGRAEDINGICSLFGVI